MRLLSKEYIDKVRSLADSPTFVSSNDLFDFLYMSAMFLLGLHIVYILSSPLANRILGKDASILEWRKLRHQIANLVVNCILVGSGVYYELRYTESLYKVSLQDRMQGSNRNIWFGSLQMGYQIWSFFAGYFHIEEDWVMLVHHIAVVFNAVAACIFYTGFRYYIPFFFGIFEASTIPLVIMNAFKDHPEWIKRYPDTYTRVRLAFAGLFLTIRLVLYIPIKITFLVDSATHLWFTHSNVNRYVYSIAYVGAVFLFFLQLMWASKIIQGLWSFFVKPKKASKKEQ
jgi:TLC domain